METLKLTSIRLEKSSLEQANRIAKEFGYYQSSNVIRAALWVGLKIVNSNNLRRLSQLKYLEEDGLAYYRIEDVIQATGQNNEGAR